MCRLFGFRSIIPSQVHRSLLSAENALGHQSNEHPDGWGVAYYIDGAPHLTRSPFTALGDQLFHRLSGVVSSQTVVAHVRKATQGAPTLLNCHPFQYGRWVFAHNGDIPAFDSFREALLREVAPELRRFILGDTDSEILFFILLTQLAHMQKPGEACSIDQLTRAVRQTLQLVLDRCQSSPDQPPLLTLMITNGDLLAAVQGGKELFCSSYKTRCSDRDTCASLSPQCEAPSTNGLVNHFILSSEPLSGENVWIELQPGDIVGIDATMRTFKTSLERPHLPVVSCS